MTTSRDGFKAEGVREVARALTDLGFEVEDLKDVFSEIAQRGQEEIASRAPHLTGSLAGNVRGNRAKNKAVVSAGGAAVPYAAAINYGWPARNIAADEFMQRGEEAIDPVALLEEGVNKKIQEKHFR